MKINPFNTKMRTSQTARACIRVTGETASLKYCRTCKPPATQASTADACSLFPHDPRHVRSQQRNGDLCKTILRGTEGPSRRHPDGETNRNTRHAGKHNVKDRWPECNASAYRSPYCHAIETSAVASLTRLSPSRIVTIRRGMCSRLAIAVADTASGARRWRPEQSPPPIPSRATERATYATAAWSRAPGQPRIAKSDGCCERNSRQEVKYAAAHKIGGRNTRNTRSGFNVTTGTRVRAPGSIRR